MATMNISLPDDMKTWVISQEATGKYRNASDYVRDLIRRDQEQAQRLAFQQAIVAAGIASGVSDLTVEDIIAEADQEYARQNQVPAE